jgi:hypothetical protein
MSTFSGTRRSPLATGSQPLRTERRFSLEVLQGKTNHRLRPLPLGRLCVGRGDKCWLRLGGEDMPEIHSWLDVGLREIALYVFEETPHVQVNAQRVRFALLRGSESLRIGTFEFVIHCQEVEPSLTKFNAPHFDLSEMADVSDVSDSCDHSFEELSANELIDRLDEELRQIARFDSRERSGLQQLLSAVRETREELNAEQKRNTIRFPRRPSLPDTPEFASLLEQLEQLTRTLQAESAHRFQPGSNDRSLADGMFPSREETKGSAKRVLGKVEPPPSDGEDENERKAIA